MTVPVIYFGGPSSNFLFPLFFQTSGPTYTALAMNSTQTSSLYRKYWNPSANAWGCAEQVWDGSGGNNYFANLSPDFNLGTSGVVQPNFVAGIHLGAGGTGGASPNDTNGIGITIQRSIEACFLPNGAVANTYPNLLPQATELFVKLPNDYLNLYAVDDANVLSAGSILPWKGGSFGFVMPGAIGPVSVGGNLFVVGIKGGSGTGPYTLCAYMSTDGGQTWAEQDAGNAITLTGGTNMSQAFSSNTADELPNWLFLTGKPTFDSTGVIYIPVRQTNGYQHTLAQFDCNSSTWSQSAADAGTAGGGPTPPDTVSMLFAFRFSSGDIIGIYNGHAFTAVVAAILSGGIGGTWGSITNKILSTTILDVKQDASGTIHLLYVNQVSSPNTYCHNTIDATGTVGTETVIADQGTYSQGGGCLTVYGNVCVAAFMRNDGSSIDAFFSDSLNPSTWTVSTVATSLEIGFPSYQGSPTGGFALAEMGLGTDPCATSSGGGPGRYSTARIG